MSQTRIRPIRPTLKRPRLEALEQRVVPTAQLYIDFGEAFGANGLTVTSAQLALDVQLGGLGGPLLPAANLNLPSMQSAITGQVDYNENGVFDNQDYEDFKSDVLSLVQRYYEPFNVVVSVVANDTVAAMNAKMVANDTAAANKSSAGIFDAYVIVSPANVLGAPVRTPAEFYQAGTDPGYFPGSAVGGAANVEDNTVLMFGDAILTGGTTRSSRALLAAYNIAQAAGLTYALPLVEGLSFFLSQDGLTLVGSDILNNLQPVWKQFAGLIPTTSGFEDKEFGQFSRFPLTVSNAFLIDTVTNDYDTLANFALSNIGAKSDPTLVGANRPNPGPIGPAYVTGTGAHDLIRITRTGPNAAFVTVEPYRTTRLSGLLDIPGPVNQRFTYSINTTGGILIDTSLGDDQVVLDGNLGTTVTVRGMGGVDKLLIDGNGAASAVYTPQASNLTGLDADPDRRGTIKIGTTTVNFQEYELAGRITIEDVQSFTFQSPAGVDDLELINSGDAIRIKGKIGGGFDFVPVSVFNATAVVIDTGSNDNPLANNNDVVLLRNILVAAGLTNVQINAGPGNDVFQIFQGRLDLPGNNGGISFLGGDGDDRVDVFAGEFLLGGDETFTFDGGGGNDVLDFRQAVVNLPRGATLNVQGGPGDDAILMGPATVYNFVFAGGDGGDTLSIAGKLNVPGGGSFRFDAGLGDDALALGAGLTIHKTATFLYDGGVGMDAIASAGTQKHSWVIGNQVITLDKRLVFNTLESVRGGPGTDEFFLGADSFLPGAIDGGGGADVLTFVQTGANRVGNVRVSLAPSATTAGFDVTAAYLGKQVTVGNIDHVGAGAGLADALVGLNSPSAWVLSARGSRYSTGKYTLGFSGFDTLAGGASDDTLFVDATPLLVGTIGKPLGTPPVVTLANVLSPRQLFDGGAGGNDAVRVTGSAASEVFGFGQNVITLQGRPLTFRNTESMTVSGGGGNDVFQLVTASYGVLRLDVYGDGGADTFNVVPPLNTALRVFGDSASGAPSGGDVLRVLPQGVPLVGPRPAPGSRSGRLQFDGRQPIDFFGFERAEASVAANGVGKPGGQFRPFF